MFTGIITEVTNIKRSQPTNRGLLITFAKPNAWTDLKLGESINTSGVCLTVADIRNEEYDCLLIPETLKKTVFGTQLPKHVSLERSMLVNDRFGGHIVQGHVDTVGKVVRLMKENGYKLTVTFPNGFGSLVIPKGSVALAGVSLTIVDVTEDSFSVALIPHTLKHTTLGSLAVGDAVNIEFDVVGKYVVNQLKRGAYHVES